MRQLTETLAHSNNVIMSDIRALINELKCWLVSVIRL